MKPISISKTLNFLKGSIEVRYNGIPKSDNIDLNKIETLLDDFINKHNHTNMIENVTIVRTILKEFEEKLLVIFFQDEKGSELVKYDNSNLFLYEKSKKEKKNEYYDGYKIKYEPPYGIKLDYNNHETDIADYPGIELTSKEITEILERIYHLKNAKTVVLDRDDKSLIEIYRLFYNENPDFSKDDINIRVQTMMYILAQFGISLEENYGFSLCGKSNMPESLNLKQKVNKLYPIGEFSGIQDVKMAEEAKKIIKIVGEVVRESITSEQNQNEALITISKIIYAGRYYFSSNDDVEKISKFFEYTQEQVESSVELVKRIHNRINKEEK